MSRLALIGFVTLVGLMAPSMAQAQPGLTQQKAEGGVTFKVTFSNPQSKDIKERLSFQIDMNTHSAPLDQYSLKELAFLRNDKGKEYGAVAWNPSGSGHHMSGALEFNNRNGQGQALTKSSSYLVLVVKNFAGVKERIFKWEIPSQGR